jgi:hypothetical protein
MEESQGFARDVYVWVKFTLIVLGVVHIAEFCITRYYSLYPTEEMRLAYELADKVQDGMRDPGPHARR